VLQQQRSRTIHSCNFRYAGRLSNENARALTAQHEKFATNVTNSLELYLGTSLHLKVLSLEQLPMMDYVKSVNADSYLLPCALNIMENSFLLEIDLKLIFPIIDLLLGGAGTTSEDARELTEIDEEIMESVTTLIIKQLELSWRSLNVVLKPGRCIRGATIQQVFLATEKLVLLRFEMIIGDTTSSLNIALPTSFVGFLLRHLKAAQSKKAASLRLLQGPTLHERILDCDFTVSADMTQMRVLVRELSDLKPGVILKMKAPVEKTGRLTVENVEMFEALPVRLGKWKAAQLSCRAQEPRAGRD
jgi:flagellar motor switch protein FliM